jgi:uncharacterized protein (TIGR00251 family)
MRVTLAVRLTPRAGRDEIGPRRDGVLQVKVKAPPVDGAANEALRRLVAKRLHVAPSRVEVVRGHRGREKLLAIDGVSEEAVARL